jgi:hypothetical protein
MRSIAYKKEAVRLLKERDRLEREMDILAFRQMKRNAIKRLSSFAICRGGYTTEMDLLLAEKRREAASLAHIDEGQESCPRCKLDMHIKLIEQLIVLYKHQDHPIAAQLLEERESLYRDMKPLRDKAGNLTKEERAREMVLSRLCYMWWSALDEFVHSCV